MAYVPAGARQAEKYQQAIAARCSGTDLKIVAITSDPDQARQMLNDGSVDKVACARAAHAYDVFPELLMVDVPARQAPALVAPAASLLGLWRRRRRHPALATATAVTAGLVVAAGAALGAGVPGTGQGGAGRSASGGRPDADSQLSDDDPEPDPD